MARLGDICIQITDGSHNPPMGVEQSNYLMLSSKNIDDDHITFNDPRYLSQEDFEAENKRTNIKPNDLLITIVGTIGRVAIVPNSLTEFCVQRSVAVLKPKPEMVYNRFLMYYLQNMRPYLEQESRGVAQKGIYLKQLSNLSIILPPLDEQRKIAAVLDKVSDLIAKRRQQLDKLDELVKAKFVEMFGTLSRPSQKFKYDILKNLCRKITDGKHGGCTPQLGSGRYFVGAREIFDDSVHYETAPEIAIDEFEKDYKRCNLEIGDLLIVNTGATIGKSAIACDFRTQHTLLQKSVALLKVKSELINPVFLKYCYRVNETMYKVESASAQPNLLLSKINTTSIYVPPMALQNQFAAFVEQTEKTKTTISESLEKLETLKKALMQEYFG